MEPIRIGDRPRFVRPLIETFGVPVIERLQPLYSMLRNDHFQVTVAQGAEAVHVLRGLLIELPTLVGTQSAEEFLIGYAPFTHCGAEAEDLALLQEWQRILGRLYRFGLNPWLIQGVPGKIDEIDHFRSELIDLFQTDLDQLVSPRVEFWAQRQHDGHNSAQVQQR